MRLLSLILFGLFSNRLVAFPLCPFNCFVLLCEATLLGQFELLLLFEMSIFSTDKMSTFWHLLTTTIYTFDRVEIAVAVFVRVVSIACRFANEFREVFCQQIVECVHDMVWHRSHLACGLAFANPI